MKKFLTLFTVIIALCVSSFAQKRTAVDPCLSKDPKVRAASKKPCPSAPAPKKKDMVTPPKVTDNSETSETEDSDDSQSNNKTSKKPNLPAQNKTPKNNPKTTDYLGTLFFITIEHNGEKTELAMTQFEEGAGNAMIENERSNRMTFFYGAGNSVKNDDDFMFNGMIPAAEKGSYALGTSGVFFSFKTDKFPNVPIFLCGSGNYDITAVPLKGGFVEGTFTVNCTGEINPNGEAEKYSMSGRFKVLRQS